MLSTEHAAMLKRVNVSKDKEKTKIRAKEAWSSLGRAEKNAIFSQTGVAKGTLYRIFSTGVITMKLLLPLARAAGFNPFYITGESETRDGFTREGLVEILRAHKYRSIVKDLEKSTEAPKSKTRRPGRGRSEAAEGGETAGEEIREEVFNDPDKDGEILSGDGKTADLPEEEGGGETEIKFSECEVICLLNEEEVTCLLKALLIKAEKGGKDAKEKLNAVLALLLA